MSYRPEEVWGHWPPQLQRQVVEDLTAVLQEVIHEQIRACYLPPSGRQSPHLYPNIRQSTPHRVLTNQESLHLQYAIGRGPSHSDGARRPRPGDAP
jgi:hypothetical protein